MHLALLALVFAWRSPLSLFRTRRPALQLGRSLLMLVMPGAWIVASHHGVDPRCCSGCSASRRSSCSRSVRSCSASVRGRACGLRPPSAGLGAIVLAGPGRAPSAMWFAVAALPPLSLSLYVVATRALRFEPLRANLWYTALGVFLALSVVVPSRWVAPTAGDWVTLVAVGGVGLLTLLLLDRATEAAPVWVTAPLLNLQIVFSDALVSGLGPHHLGAGLAPRCVDDLRGRGHRVVACGSPRRALHRVRGPPRCDAHRLLT